MPVQSRISKWGNSLGVRVPRDIAARAGLSYPGLLHHFPDKAAILIALMARRDAEEEQRGTSGLGREGETAAESATRHLVAMLREHQAAPELMRLWIELTAAGSRPDHPAHDYLVERYARIRGLAVEGYRSAPPKPSLQPEPTAILLIAVLDGLEIQALLDPTVDVAAAIEQFIAMTT